MGRNTVAMGREIYDAMRLTVLFKEHTQYKLNLSLVLTPPRDKKKQYLLTRTMNFQMASLSFTSW